MAVTEPDSTNKVIPDNDKNATTLKRICFSDIDGTLVCPLDALKCQCRAGLYYSRSNLSQLHRSWLAIVCAMVCLRSNECYSNCRPQSS